jgi:hypothetical protein
VFCCELRGHARTHAQTAQNVNVIARWAPAHMTAAAETVAVDRNCTDSGSVPLLSPAEVCSTATFTDRLIKVSADGLWHSQFSCLHILCHAPATVL